eukprot:858982_1
MNSKQLTHPIPTHERLPVYGIRTCVTASGYHQFIFIMGGSTTHEHYANLKQKVFLFYDINLGFCKGGPNMTIVRSMFSCNVIHNYLYAMGGDTSMERIYA